MYRGHQEDAWQHTSSLMSLIANCNRDSKRQPNPFTPSSFNPFAKQRSSRGEPLTVETLESIQQAIRERKKRR